MNLTLCVSLWDGRHFSGLQAVIFFFSDKSHPLTPLFSHFPSQPLESFERLASAPIVGSLEFLIRLGVGLRTGLFEKFPGAASALGPRSILSGNVARVIKAHRQKLGFNPKTRKAKQPRH